MKLMKNKQHYLLLVAIFFTLIGLIALFLGTPYENSVEGTHGNGMYNMFEYITRLCLFIGSFSFVGFVLLLIISKHKDNENK
jgi:multisubunit Na+/H+ antiporter MnhG subunit